MMRPSVWLPIAALALFGGCQQGPGVGVDPFGRTTIPPPPTGAAAVHSSSDPYYSGPGKAAPPLVPIGSNTGTAAGQANLNQVQTPPNHWISTASQTEPNTSGRLQPIPPYDHQKNVAQPIAVTAPPPTAGGPIQATGNQAPLTNPAPTTSAGGLRWSSSTPTATASSGTASTPRTDLASLPKKSVANTTANTASPPHPATNVTTRREITPNATPRTARYGHAKDYTRLQGRLEYAVGTRQWKLHYIPTHGQMDTYGGSVDLAANAALEDYQAGDYVIVHGRFDQHGSQTDSGPVRYIPSGIAPLH